MGDFVNIFIGAPDGQTAVSLSSADKIHVSIAAGFTGSGGGGGGGSTNLSTTRTATTVTVNSDTGTDATIAAADSTNAGVMTAAMQTKLAGIEAGAEVNDSASEILTKILTVDGSGSGLDADLLDGNHASAFAAAVHTHAIGDVTGLQTALDGKAATVHTHAIGDVTGLQTALDGKVDENAAITPGTKTKITYDAKGLVTAGADATTADISDSLNKRYVTDADLTKLSNTSGTNTGDQTITLTGDVTGTGTGSFAATIANNAVTLAKIQDITTARIIGRVTAGSGDPEELTGTQATTLLDTFTSSLKGLAPASGGGTSNFLRADGTWAAAGGGGGATNLWVAASQMIPRTSNSTGIDSRELATNDTNFDELLFDAGADEFAQFLVIMPNNYANGTVTARFYWTASTGSGDVVWGLQGRAFADDDALDTAFGTAQTVTDTLIATNDMHVTSATSAITIGGTPAANRPILFQVYRDADAAGDTFSADARLLGIEIIF